MSISLEDRLNRIEIKLSHLEAEAAVKRCKKDLQKRRVLYSSSFIKVPSNYYERTLEERVRLLNANNVYQLCKSIIFENTACDHNAIDDKTNSRYYIAIVQYGAKFDAELLKDVIYNLRDTNKLSRKKFSFQLASPEDSLRLSGYRHNAVTPFGMLANLPVVICSNCLKMKPSYIWMGGGDINLKLGMLLTDFIRVTSAIIGTISTNR